MILYIHQCADRYLLIRLASLEVVGLYSIGMTIASVIALLTAGFRTAWVPIVLSTFRQEESKKFYAKVFDYFWALVLLGAVGISLFSKEILVVLAPATYLDAYTVIPVLLLSIFFFHAFPVFSFGISIAKKTKYRLLLMAVTAAINIGLNYLLIPDYGMVGAAIATLIASVIYGIASFIVSQRFYHVSYNLAALFKILAVVVAIISISYFLLSDINVVNILIKIGLVVVFIVCGYLFNLVGKEEMKYLRAFVHSRIFKEDDRKNQ